MDQVVLNKLLNTIRYNMRAKPEYAKMEWREFKKHLHNEFVNQAFELENELDNDEPDFNFGDEELEKSFDDYKKRLFDAVSKNTTPEPEPVKPKRKRRTKKEMEELRRSGE